jgi:hypothetical protein
MLVWGCKGQINLPAEYLGSCSICSDTVAVVIVLVDVIVCDIGVETDAHEFTVLEATSDGFTILLPSST